MKLSEIQDEWKKDCEINQGDLGEEATNVPRLHAKYVSLLTNIKLQQRKSDTEYYKLRQVKEKYYRGELSREELADLGWDQYQLNKPLKNEIDNMLQADDDIIRLVDKVEYYKTVAYLLEQIIKSINSRTWDIKSAIEWKKWISGG